MCSGGHGADGGQGDHRQAGSIVVSELGNKEGILFDFVDEAMFIG
jgi:hypothetical protein